MENKIVELVTMTKIINTIAEDPPASIPKHHQLKKELLALFASGEFSSNWSAAKVVTHGLCPPSPTGHWWDVKCYKEHRFTGNAKGLLRLIWLTKSKPITYNITKSSYNFIWNIYVRWKEDNRLPIFSKKLSC